MSQTILLLVAIVIVGIIVALALSRRTREGTAGICRTALDQTVRKSANKQKALEFIKLSGEAGNEQIRAHLGVSARTTVRYMDELEREEKVEQVGKIGHLVIYRLKLK